MNKQKRTSRNEDDAPSTKRGSWMKKGSAISQEEEKLNAENARRAEQRKRTGGIDPNKHRFRIREPGDSREIIILDEEIDTVAFYEHRLKKDGKWGHFEGCPAEWSNCPLCASGDHNYFVWFLSILELDEWTRDDGTVVPYSRRLLPIKNSQANAFKRILKAAHREHGTIRGVVLLLERDTAAKSANLGEPVIMDNGKMYDFMDEDTLIEDYGHASIKSKGTGEVLVKKNGLLQPFDYDALFPKPDAKDIAKRWGLGAQAGSDEEYEEEAAKGNARTTKALPKSRKPVADDADAEEEETPRRATRRSAAPWKDDDDDDGDDDMPAAKPKRKKPTLVDDDDDDDDGEAVAPVRRTRRAF